MNAVRVVKELNKKKSAERAKVSARFFKTGRGQYGEGDIFWGVTVPEIRTIAKSSLEIPLVAIKKLLTSKVHEQRLVALIILVEKYKRADDVEKETIVAFYLSNTKHINNWDLVDTSASYILGEYLFKRSRNKLHVLAVSKNMWERRIAIVSTYYFIQKRDLKDTFLLSEKLLKDKEDLIHKAVGWMLRETGKRDQAQLEAFLKKHITILPRTTLRYAIEKFPENIRKDFIKMK